MPIPWASVMSVGAEVGKAVVEEVSARPGVLNLASSVLGGEEADAGPPEDMSSQSAGTFTKGDIVVASGGSGVMIVIAVIGLLLILSK